MKLLNKIKKFIKSTDKYDHIDIIVDHDIMYHIGFWGGTILFGLSFVLAIHNIGPIEIASSIFWLSISTYLLMLIGDGPRTTLKYNDKGKELLKKKMEEFKKLLKL
mgnify:FL=1